MKEELKAALEALEIADNKLYESNYCPVSLYDEVSGYIGIAKDILTRETEYNRRSHSAPTTDEH